LRGVLLLPVTDEPALRVIVTYQIDSVVLIHDAFTRNLGKGQAGI
jgi:hypothetical protein